MNTSGADRLLRVLIASLLAVMLSSCGLKGDLYLPEPEKSASDTAPANAANTDESEDARKKASGEQPTPAPSLP